MTSPACLRFNETLRDLSRFLQAVEDEDRLVPLLEEAGNREFLAPYITRQSQWLRGNRSLKRRFHYTTVIIQLYGALERYVEDAIEEICTFHMATFDSFEKLPESIRTNLRQKVAELLVDAYGSRYPGPGDYDTVARELVSCLSTDSSEYQLPIAAFQRHRANFRCGTIETALSILAIPNAVSRGVRSRTGELNAINQDLDVETSISRVDELADRRNEVAHGRNPDLLSIGILREWVTFFQTVVAGIDAVIEADIWGARAKAIGIELPEPVAVYNSNIACFALDGPERFYREQIVIVATAPTPLLSAWGKPTRMEVSNKAVEYIEIAAGQQLALCLELPFNTRKNAGHWLLKSPDASSH